MANSKISKTSDRKTQKNDLLARVKKLLNSNDKEVVNALRVMVGALENTLPGKEGGAV